MITSSLPPLTALPLLLLEAVDIFLLAGRQHLAQHSVLIPLVQTCKHSSDWTVAWPPYCLWGIFLPTSGLNCFVNASAASDVSRDHNSSPFLPKKSCGSPLRKLAVCWRWNPPTSLLCSLLPPGLGLSRPWRSRVRGRTGEDLAELAEQSCSVRSLENWQGSGRAVLGVWKTGKDLLDV